MFGAEIYIGRWHTPVQSLFLSVNLISQKLNLFYDLISRNFFDLIRAFLENVIRLSLKGDLPKCVKLTLKLQLTLKDEAKMYKHGS